MENEILNGWVFHFNPFTKNWVAINRNDYLEYWNNHKSKKVIKSSSIQTLVELIIKTDGDITKINKLVSAKKKN
jgi:hypothetical protein